jgi:Holliday junction resolvase RusA-like endonuclease
MTLEFTVYGVAQQMGSKRAFVPKGWTRPIITDSNRNLKAWQVLVSEAAAAAIRHLPKGERRLLADGVRVNMAFYLPRPKHLPKRITAHTKAPDLDKLARSLCDSLSRVVFEDDSQIVDLIACKRYATIGDIPHVHVRVEPSAGVVPLATDQPLFVEMRYAPRAERSLGAVDAD